MAFVEWNHHHGEHTEFYEKLERGGKDTPLSDKPELDQESSDLWQLYCFTGDDILVSIDIYANRIGLPYDWEFEECCLLVSAMRNKRHELKKVKDDG